MTSKLVRFAAGATTALLAASFLAACGGASTASATTCEKYLGLSPDEQVAARETLMREINLDPADAAIASQVEISVMSFCAVPENSRFELSEAFDTTDNMTDDMESDSTDNMTDEMESGSRDNMTNTRESESQSH